MKIHWHVAQYHYSKSGFRLDVPFRHCPLLVHSIQYQSWDQVLTTSSVLTEAEGEYDNHGLLHARYDRVRSLEESKGAATFCNFSSPCINSQRLNQRLLTYFILFFI